MAISDLRTPNDHLLNAVAPHLMKCLIFQVKSYQGPFSATRACWFHKSKQRQNYISAKAKRVCNRRICTSCGVGFQTTKGSTLLHQESTVKYPATNSRREYQKGIFEITAVCKGIYWFISFPTRTVFLNFVVWYLIRISLLTPASSF